MTAAPRSVRPLGLADYETPVAWWGWSWEPPVPMSITELVAARDLDARTAALCWLLLAGHGALLVALRVEPAAGGVARRMGSLDRLSADGPRAMPVGDHDAGLDVWIHDAAAEAARVAERHGCDLAGAERAIARRAERIADLARDRVFGIEQVKVERRRMNEGDRP